MINARQLLAEYELGVVKELQLIEWACAILSGDDAIAKDQDLIRLAGLLPSVRAEIEMAGEYFRRLIQRHFPEFRLRSPEGVQLAREILKRRCEEYVDGRIAPYDLCALVSPIEQHFDFPVWLGNLYNACDWVEPSTKHEEVPYWLKRRRRPMEPPNKRLERTAEKRGG